MLYRHRSEILLNPTKKKKSNGVKSQIRGDQLMSPFRDIMEPSHAIISVFLAQYDT